MLYIQESLSADEELIHVGKFHWMYTFAAVMGIVWGLVGCIAMLIGGVWFQTNFGEGFYSQGWLGMIRELHPGIRLGAFFIFLMGLLSFAQRMIVKATT